MSEPPIDEQTVERIEAFFDYFGRELHAITEVVREVHQLLLSVAVLDTLARSRYPELNQGKNKKRFTRLIKEHSDWPDAARVSLPQLAMRVEREGGTIDRKFAANIQDRMRNWTHGSIYKLDADPAENELEAPSDKEWKLVRAATHCILLYTERSCLVHELRRKGHGMHFTGEDTPYYHSMTWDDKTTWELVYPPKFVLSLVEPVIASLRSHFRSQGTNPYSSFDFGSIW